MNEITIAIISAAASVIVATLGYVFSKLKEREADWRKKKLEMYHELFSAISGITKGDATPEAQRNYAKACNTIGLVASPEVILAVQRLQKVATGTSIEQHDAALTCLLREIRKDLKLPLSDNIEFTYRLWASGAEKK